MHLPFENRRLWSGVLMFTVRRLFGFLLGATTAAGGMYYYVIDEYRISNELLTEDIYVRVPLSYISDRSYAVNWALTNCRRSKQRCSG